MAIPSTSSSSPLLPVDSKEPGFMERIGSRLTRLFTKERALVVVGMKPLEKAARISSTSPSEELFDLPIQMRIEAAARSIKRGMPREEVEAILEEKDLTELSRSDSPLAPQALIRIGNRASSAFSSPAFLSLIDFEGYVSDVTESRNERLQLMLAENEYSVACAILEKNDPSFVTRFFPYIRTALSEKSAQLLFDCVVDTKTSEAMKETLLQELLSKKDRVSEAVAIALPETLPLSPETLSLLCYYKTSHKEALETFQQEVSEYMAVERGSAKKIGLAHQLIQNFHPSFFLKIGEKVLSEIMGDITDKDARIEFFSLFLIEKTGSFLG